MTCSYFLNGIPTKTTKTIFAYDNDGKILVLRRWERWKQKFGFIKRVDKGWRRAKARNVSFLNLSRW